jgi:transposase InsO family protein
MPQTVLTDQGTNFESAIFRETCKLLKIKKIHGTSFHPQTNGSLERTHRTLAEYRRSFINRDRDTLGRVPTIRSIHIQRGPTLTIFAITRLIIVQKF